MIKKEVEGDVFDRLNNLSRHTYFLHGCNSRGGMGAGVAKKVKETWPMACRDYKNHCALFNSSTGPMKDMDIMGTNCYHISENGDNVLYIVNGITQRNYGKNPNKIYASISAIEKCIKDVEEDVKFSNSVIPNLEFDLVTVRVGCGYGGLDWERDVKPLFEKSSLSWEVYYI